jgi:glycine/D-amino acid oxidase-like deaminating enzyme
LRVDAVVVCAGVASRRFAAMLGDRVNVYPVKGYSITVHLDDEGSRAAAPAVSLLDDRPRSSPAASAAIASGSPARRSSTARTATSVPTGSSRS